MKEKNSDAGGRGGRGREETWDWDYEDVVAIGEHEVENIPGGVSGWGWVKDKIK